MHTARDAQGHRKVREIVAVPGRVEGDIVETADVLLANLWLLLRQRVALHDDRGDVPGWVLITLMTAGIVMALWIVAEPKLSSLLSSALNISGDPNK